jgi:hypothetical protein
MRRFWVRHHVDMKSMFMSMKLWRFCGGGNRILNSCATYTNSHSCFKTWAILSSTRGSIDVGLSGEFVHNINLIAGKSLVFCGTLFTPPCWVNRSLISHYKCPKSVLFSKCFWILPMPLLWMGKLVLYCTWCRIWFIVCSEDYLMHCCIHLLMVLRIENHNIIQPCGSVPWLWIMSIIFCEAPKNKNINLPFIYSCRHLKVWVEFYS